ncbi:hypothetical protein [Glycomyces sp. NPDC047010]|uniref:hypothetical protein n=1 Tax=Glycomyces sp. NPDC047010 TaxID=3155023 RepID=UPI0033C2B488
MSELDARPYAGIFPDTSPVTTEAAEDAQKLHVSIRDRDGDAPDGTFAYWAERSGAEFGDLPIDENGEGSVALPPGDYVLVTGFWTDATDTERGQSIMGMTEVTIEDEAQSLVIDGAAAAPVSVEVERDDAELLSAIVTIGAGDGSKNLGYGTFLSPQDDAYLLPEPDLAGFELDFLYQPVLTGPEGDAGPYVYNLAFHEVGGFPDDAVYDIADEDLATVETSYLHLGTPYGAEVGKACDYGDYIGHQIGLGFCRVIPTAAPSERTMYYTADPEILWDNGFQTGERDARGSVVDGFLVFHDQVFEPGTVALSMPNGGLSAGTGEFFRTTDGEGAAYLGAEAAPIGGGNDEELIVIGAKGDMELSRDGETIATATGFDFYWDELYAGLPNPEPGRYTLRVDVTQAATGSVFGTDGSAEWRFDSGPIADDFEHLPLPVVQLTSADIEGGYADRRGCQEITLDLRAFKYGEVVHAEDMTFAVSYDDGATWKDVAIDRDGDTATAELVHPRGAEWVSVRMTALDDRGTEVEHTTIRAWGLD